MAFFGIREGRPGQTVKAVPRAPDKKPPNPQNHRNAKSTFKTDFSDRQNPSQKIVKNLTNIWGPTYARPLIVVKLFSGPCIFFGSQNKRSLVEVLVLVLIGRSGRLLGFVSTHFRPD